MLPTNEQDENTEAWDVEPNWWWRTPKDFTKQIEKWCPRCGFAVNLERRISTDEIDDISISNYERMKNYSKKIKQNKYRISDLKIVSLEETKNLASYKDFDYRNKIASRYGIYLTINDQCFWTPHLIENYVKQKSYLEILQEKHR
jgi:hypothetical protein